jgi:hypothetical protein
MNRTILLLGAVAALTAAITATGRAQIPAAGGSSILARSVAVAVEPAVVGFYAPRAATARNG